MPKESLLQLGLLQFTLNAPESSETFSFNLASQTKVSLLSTGVLLFEPTPMISTRAVVLSAGIHGNETAPIECIDELVSKILNMEVELQQPLLVILGNPPAMVEAKRELMLNLNRLFIGKHANYDDCYEVRRAKHLEEIVKQFFTRYSLLAAYHLDLHTAIRSSQHEKFAVHPFTHGRARKQSSLALLQACEVDCVLFSNEPASTFSYHSSYIHNAAAFTVELGKVHAFGQNDPNKLKALSQTLTTLLGASDLSELLFNPSRATLFEVSDVLNKTTDDFCFNFNQSQANFTEYPNGYRLAKDGSRIIEVENGPKAIVFPNDKVAIGQRAVLLVKQMTQADIQQAITDKNLI
ncbi:succinylglutamate desuccinylase [Agarivorans sp. DSG3-1]|uniref:succinylglutamate desuccinylase n=1 Tax=Agarivorans sp. DSG3-1 TaxID=3342249 RepID=UPI00398F4384